MSRKRISLKDWIQQACQDSDKQKPCSMISLVYVKANGIGQEEVHSKELSATVNFEQLAEAFTTKACNFAQDMPGLQTFRLLAFYGETEPKASHQFVVTEGALAGGDVSQWSKHEATPQGLQAQLMKHNEHILGDYRALSQGIIVALMQRDQEHDKEKAEMHGILRDVLLNLRKESHEMEMAKLKFQRESEERAMLARLIGPGVNYLTGKEIVPVNQVDTQILEGIANRIKPEQLAMFAQMTGMSPQEALIVTNRFKQIKEEAEKKQAAIKAAPPEEPASEST